MYVLSNRMNKLNFPSTTSILSIRILSIDNTKKKKGRVPIKSELIRDEVIRGIKVSFNEKKKIKMNYVED